MNRIMLIVLTVALLFSFVGCSKTVYSYTSFSIENFDDFFAISDISAKELYIKDGNMDFARIGDLIICPFIKETSHEACSLFVYVYTAAPSSSTAWVTEVSLTATNDIIICEGTYEKLMVEMNSVTETMLSGFTMVSEFNKSKTWFYSGSELQLSLKINVEDGTTVTEDSFMCSVKLIEHRRHLLPT